MTDICIKTTLIEKGYKHAFTLTDINDRTGILTVGLLIKLDSILSA